MSGKPTTPSTTSRNSSKRKGLASEQTPAGAPYSLEDNRSLSFVPKKSNLAVSSYGAILGSLKEKNVMSDLLKTIESSAHTIRKLEKETLKSSDTIKFQKSIIIGLDKDKIELEAEIKRLKCLLDAEKDEKLEAKKNNVEADSKQEEELEELAVKFFAFSNKAIPPRDEIKQPDYKKRKMA